MRYIAIMDRSEGAFGVMFPDLPGCTAMGDTKDEALSNASTALHDWMAHHDAHQSDQPSPQCEEAIRATYAQELADGAVLVTVTLAR